MHLFYTLQQFLLQEVRKSKDYGNYGNYRNYRNYRSNRNYAIVPIAPIIPIIPIIPIARIIPIALIAPLYWSGNHGRAKHISWGSGKAARAKESVI